MDGFPSAKGHWPSTHWSLIDTARGGNRQAFEQIVHTYYKPILRFFQRVLRIREQQVLDVTQDFFTRFVEKDFLGKIHYEKSFRGFLKLACRRHYINWLEAQRVRKPKEGVIHGMNDGEGAAVDIPMPEEKFNELMDEELRRWYLEEAMERTRKKLAKDGKEVYFRILEARTRFEDEKPTSYQALSDEFGIKIFDIRNHLTAARKVFRRMLQEIAAERADDHKCELTELRLKEYLA